MNITTIQPRVVEILLTAHVFKTHVDCRGQVGRRHLLGTAINIQNTKYKYKFIPLQIY